MIRTCRWRCLLVLAAQDDLVPSSLLLVRAWGT